MRWHALLSLTMKTENKEKLVKILAQHLNRAPEEIVDTLSYDQESRWDSVTHLKIMADIEDAFHIHFDIEEIISLETVLKIKQKVAEKIDHEPR